MGYNIIKIEDKTKRKVYFEINFPGYRYITNNDTGDIQYYNGKNSRINNDYYISISSLVKSRSSPTETLPFLSLLPHLGSAP